MEKNGEIDRLILLICGISLYGLKLAHFQCNFCISLSLEVVSDFKQELAAMQEGKPAHPSLYLNRTLLLLNLQKGIDALPYFVTTPQALDADCRP